MCFFQSCSSESISPDTLDLELDYYPLVAGRTWEYKYDSIVYKNRGARKDTQRGYFRYVLEPNPTPNSYKVTKFIKKTINAPYKINRIDQVNLVDKSIITTEGNLEFTSLVLPPIINTKWNGNKAFDENISIQIDGGDKIQIYLDWSYQYINIDTTINIENKIFPKVIKVSHIDRSDAINRRLSREYYAKGVGLVLKEMEMYETQRIEPNTPWPLKAQAGFSLKLQLISYQ
jgi:hypothetical protein